MSWRSAFLLQARSDNQIRRELNRTGVHYCHELHYLQMAAEKLAKALMTLDTDSEPPPFTHAALTNGLKTLKGRRDIRRRLGYERYDHFCAAVDSLLPLASSIERLAPALAGSTKPNPEYPWRPTRQVEVIAPAEYPFSEFSPRDPRMAKFLVLFDRLLEILD